MPVRYFTHNEIDKNLWDDTVTRSPNGVFYALSWYLDLVSPGWDALADENYESIFPLTHKKKYGISYLCQPRFTQQLGLISKARVSSDRVNLFLHSFPRQFRYVEINLNKDNIASQEGFIFKQNIDLELDISSDISEIRKAYSQNLTRNLKKAAKSELHYEQGATNIHDMISLFRKNKGSELDNLSSTDYALLSLLLNEIIRHGKGEVHSAFNKSGNMIAAAFFATFREKRIFLFSATCRESKETGAMSGLIDHYISLNCGQKCILDFEGSNDTKLARFYRGFGSKAFTYQQVKKNNLPPVLRWMKK
ncbi:MAG: hypothetical protein V2A54_13455 [Bacteroidota bacterium]